MKKNAYKFFVRRLTKTLGIPKMFADLSVEGIETMISRDDDYALALKRIAQIGADIDELKFRANPVFVALVGHYGVGKTRIATTLLARSYMAILEAELHTSGANDPYFFPAAKLAEERFRFKKDEDEEDDESPDLREKAERSAFAVIDDVNRLPGYRGEELFLEQVIEKRLNDGRSTILTFSSNKGVIEKVTRLYELLNYFEVIPMEGESFRKPLSGG